MPAQPLRQRMQAAPRPGARGRRADDVDLQVRAALDQLLGQGAVDHARQRPLARAAQHQGGHAGVAGVVEQGVGDVGAVQQLGLAAQAAGQGEGAVDLLLAVGVEAAPLHGDHGPRRAAAFGDAPGHAHQVLALAAAVDGHQHAPAHGHAGLAARGGVLAQRVVHVLGRGLHGQLAQRGEVGRREERLQRLRRLVGQIDLALLQAFDQLARRDVDQHDVVEPVEHRIGHGLGHAHAGDAQHHVVEAFQMLDVDRGPHVDAGIEQFDHVLPAALVAAARRVAVRQLVHQHQGRLARQQRVQVHLLQHPALVLDALARLLRQAFGQGGGLAAAMGLHDADHQVGAAPELLARAAEHGVGLAHAGRRAEEHGELAAVLALQALDEGVGLAGAGVGHGEILLGLPGVLVGWGLSIYSEPSAGTGHQPKPRHSRESGNPGTLRFCLCLGLPYSTSVPRG